MQEVPFDFKFPSKGIDVDSGNESQPIGTSADCLNTRAFESLTARNRGGSREFLTRYINDQLPGEIQHINFITSVDGTAFLGAFDGFPPYISSSSLGGATNWAPDPSSQFNVNGLERNNEGWAPIGGTGVNLGKKKKRPVRIIWSPPDGTEGQALDSTFLNAVAVDARDGTALNGTMSYNPGFGYILRRVNKSSTRVKLRVLWTPGFFINDEYDPKRKIVTITVTKPAAVITWSDPSDVVTGTALSGTQLNAVATHPLTGLPLPGNFSYTPPSGTVLTSGQNQALATTFTPTDTTIDPSSSTVYIDVGTIAFVQVTADNFRSTSSASASKAFSSNVTSGNLILVGVSVQAGSSSQSSSGTVTVSDSRGNTYTQIGTAATGIGTGVNVLSQAHHGLWLFYAFANSSGAITFTVTSSLSNFGGPIGLGTDLGGISAVAAEYSGASALDSNAKSFLAQQTGTGHFQQIATTTSVTITQTPSLLVGVYHCFTINSSPPGTPLATNGVLRRAELLASAPATVLADEIAASAPNYAITMEFDSTNVSDNPALGWLSIGASFR